MVGMNHGAIALVLLAGVASAADSPLQPLDFLVGHCWRGAFPDGKAVDTHCFESMLGGHFVRDRHVVRGERPDYSGESIYWFDPKSNRVSYVYFNSDGGQSTGTLAVDGERLQFGDETYTGPDGKVQRYRTVWERKGADAYVATTEQEANGTWTGAWRIEFARVPPAK
jgi:Protein of unknown function (DUF1579)